MSCPLNPVPLFLASAFVKALFAHVRGGYQAYFAGSGVTAPLAVICAKIFNKRSVVYLHGLDIIADNWMYQHVFVPFFRHADQVIVNSRNTAKLAQQKGVATARIEIIHPGVDVTPPVNTDFIQRHGLSGAKLLLSVGRIIPRKGLAEFIIHALPDIIRRVPDAKLLVIGGAAHQALKKSGGAMAALQQAIDSTQLRQHVILLGYVNDEDLATAYKAAKVFIFPLQDVPDDVEGFGMVAVEAAAHGLPTVAFDVGGVADAIGGECGALVKAEDYSAFSAKVVEILATAPKTGQDNACIKHAKRFAWPLFGEHLTQVFQRVVSDPKDA